MEVSVDDEYLQGFFRTLDAQNIDMAARNSKEWFKKDLTADQLSATLYRHSIMPDQSGRFAPLVRLKVNGPGTRRPTRIFVARPTAEGGMEYKPGTIEDCPPQSHVTPIVELGGMWFISKGFGCAINCTDLLVYPAKAKDEAFPFVISQGAGAAVDTSDHGAKDTAGGLDDAM
jgi:hypothetical protein